MMEWAHLNRRWNDGEVSTHWFASPDGEEWLEFKEPPPPDAAAEITDYLANGKDGFLPIRMDRRYIEFAALSEGSSVVFFTQYPQSYLKDRRASVVQGEDEA